MIDRRTFLTAATLAALVAIQGAGMFYALRSSSAAEAPYPQAEAPSIYRMGCDGWYHTAEVKPCRFGSVDAAHTLVLIGDSTSAQWFPALHTIFDRLDWQIVVLTKSYCPMVDAPIFYDRIGREYTECAEWRDAALDVVAEMRPDVVLVGTANHYAYTPAQWTQGTANVLRRLSDAAGEVRVIRSTPLLDGESVLLHDDVAAWQQEAMLGLPNVTELDMNPAVCPGGKCVRRTSAGERFRDDRHLATDFAAKLWPELYLRIKPPGHRHTPSTGSSLTPRQ